MKAQAQGQSLKALIGELLDGALWMRGGGSSAFWERHYRLHGTSGPGSRGRLAEHKASIVNGLVADHGIRSITELGCGDGYQAALLEVPRYIGLDVSRSAIERCARTFDGDSGKTFVEYDESTWSDGLGLFRSELGLSMDVIFHLVEDEVFHIYMCRLFDLGEKYVLIYSSDDDEGRERLYTRRRSFTGWVADHRPSWTLEQRIPNALPALSKSEFFLYRRESGP